MSGYGPSHIGEKRHKIGASPRMHYIPSRKLCCAGVKGCKGAFILWVCFSFFLFFRLRSGASCALHRSLFRNVVSAWESCEGCRGTRETAVPSYLHCASGQWKEKCCRGAAARCWFGSEHVEVSEPRGLASFR